MRNGKRFEHDQDEVRIRLLTRADDEALGRLAQLDSARTPAGPALGAFSRGRLLAALSLGDGGMIADPFTRTAELRGVLGWRAAQYQQRPRRGLRALLGRVSRGTLPASPPGAGGRLLDLRSRRSA